MLVPTPVLRLRESIEPPPEGRGGPDPERPEAPLAGIRCPRCGWQPGPSDRWRCSCETVWNTFDTGGRCPGCSHQWTMTACLACHEWSPHLAWYEPGAARD